MTFSELLFKLEKSGLQNISQALHSYLLLNFPQKDYFKAGQMFTDLIVDWEPQPVRQDDWIHSQDFAYTQNLASHLRVIGFLPPPEPVIMGELVETLPDEDVFEIERLASVK